MDAAEHPKSQASIAPECVQRYYKTGLPALSLQASYTPYPTIMHAPSVLDILRHTPWWAYMIFMALLALGWQQSRNRVLSVRRLVTLPLCMLALSLVSVASAFGRELATFAFWALGVSMAIAVVFYAARPNITPPIKTFNTPATSSAQPMQERLLLVPGSWWPLGCMMGIFCIQYAVGFARARQPALIAQPWVGSMGSWLLGFLSGIFLARAWRIYLQQRGKVPMQVTTHWR